MQSSNPNDPTGQQHRTHSENTDRQQSAQRRSKSAGEIADAADKLTRGRQLDRLFVRRYRHSRFEHVNGRVHDVACCTGRNFPYLLPSSEVVGIDLRDGMLTRARDELDGLGLDDAVHKLDARTLDFPDDSFDTVISSFSFFGFVTAMDAIPR